MRGKVLRLAYAIKLLRPLRLDTKTKDDQMAKGGKARCVATDILFDSTSYNSERQNYHCSDDFDRPDGFLLYHETSPAEQSKVVCSKI